jgi:hypothetical protein
MPKYEQPNHQYRQVPIFAKFQTVHQVSCLNIGDYLRKQCCGSDPRYIPRKEITSTSMLCQIILLFLYLLKKIRQVMFTFVTFKAKTINRYVAIYI